MPFTVTMPKLSPTMEAGTVVKWLKKEGDFVEAGQPLLEIATDKATVEHTALDEGYLRKTLVKEGDEAIVNQAIAIFTVEKQEDIQGYVPEGVQMKAKAQEQEAPKGEIKGEKAGEKAQPQEAPASKKEAVAQGAGLATPAFTPMAPLTEYVFEGAVSSQERILASPLARQLAKEKHLDLSSVQGSGPGGRIVKRDLAKAPSSGGVGLHRYEAPTIPPGTYEEEKLTPMRKAIGKTLQQSKTFVPHFYVTQEIDAQPLVELRAQLATYELKLSISDFITRATALALRSHPAMNSGYNSVNDTLIRFKTIDIAMAVSVPTGLLTPVIRHADYKHVGQISAEIRDFATRAREGKLAPEEYAGGSFTISNLGMYGITEFDAVINPPQAAILAVAAVRDVAVVKEGKVVPGKVMNVTLSADHRVVDGVDAATFLKTLKSYLESPAGLLV